MIARRHGHAQRGGSGSGTHADPHRADAAGLVIGVLAVLFLLCLTYPTPV